MPKKIKSLLKIFCYVSISASVIYLVFLHINYFNHSSYNDFDVSDRTPSIYRIEGLESDLNTFGNFRCKVNADIVTLYSKKYSIFNIRLGNEVFINNLEVDLFKRNTSKIDNTVINDKTSNIFDGAEIENYISNLLPTKALYANGKISNLFIRIHSTSELEKTVKAKEGKVNLIDNTVILKDVVFQLKDVDQIIFCKTAKLNLNDFTINVSDSYYTVGKEKIIKDKGKTIKL